MYGISFVFTQHIILFDLYNNSKRCIEEILLTFSEKYRVELIGSMPQR
jgi:hypothetical protein